MEDIIYTILAILTPLFGSLLGKILYSLYCVYVDMSLKRTENEILKMKERSGEYE